MKNDTDTDADRLFNNFTRATKKITEHNVSQGDQLKLYGLYKQALFGDNSHPEPSLLNYREYRKYHAWLELKGLSRQKAMKNYITLARTYYKEL